MGQYIDLPRRGMADDNPWDDINAAIQTAQQAYGAVAQATGQAGGQPVTTAPITTYGNGSGQLPAVQPQDRESFIERVREQFSASWDPLPTAVKWGIGALAAWGLYKVVT